MNYLSQLFSTRTVVFDDAKFCKKYGLAESILIAEVPTPYRSEHRAFIFAFSANPIIHARALYACLARPCEIGQANEFYITGIGTIFDENFLKELIDSEIVSFK